MGVTLQDIAQACGVSNATVSRVITGSGPVKPETRDRIMKTIRQYNYVPNAIARSLSRSVTNTVGVVVPDIENPFFGSIIRGITTVLRNIGYNIVLCDTEEKFNYEIDALDALTQERVRGIIIAPTIERENPENRKHMLPISRKTPVVLIDRDIAYSHYSGVFFDNISAGREATEALINAGHTKIAAVFGPKFSRSNIERYQGYCNAFEMNDIAVNESYLFNSDHYTTECGFEIMRKILNLKDRPTAVFAGSNSLTAGCINCLLDQHIKIPEEMAIVGFDSTKKYDPFGLHISFVERSISEMGKTAARLLEEQIEVSDGTEKIQKRIIIPSKLVLKGSEIFYIRKFCG